MPCSHASCFTGHLLSYRAVSKKQSSSQTGSQTKPEMIQRVPLNEPGLVIRAIKEDGGVILTGFSSVEDVQKVNADAAPYINAIVDDRKSRSLPRETTRCTLLFGGSTTAREVWLQQSDLQAILKHFLCTVSVPYNDANGKELATSFLLSAAATLDIGPEVGAQDLHRDDFIWQQTHKVGDEKIYALGSDVAMGLLVPGVNTTAENGATLVKLPLVEILAGGNP
ncbi:hypothetical protein MMC11_007443 [Xylographa trunciseda]|nr:hypothetical protein [Xylographa trunciseda]